MSRQQIEEAYMMGWYQCATWANREDLKYDVGSAAYQRDRDSMLAEVITRLQEIQNNGRLAQR